jgi:hypothetical protein
VLEISLRNLVRLLLKNNNNNNNNKQPKMVGWLLAVTSSAINKFSYSQ